LRISNFGNLVSITDESEISDEDIIIIKNILIKYDFIYIPRDILDKKYNGINKNNNIRTRRIRYFDYI
jgi:hypothetical protein